jgi:hypothetical protein
MAATSVGYSGTPLAKKLGLREDSTVLLIDAPDDYEQLVCPLPSRVRFVSRPSGTVDMAHVFVTRRSFLQKHLNRLRDILKPDVPIWISWPKKSSKVATDITEDIIRDVALPLGLVDIKVCAVSEIWSGLKIVVRKENR